MKNKLRFYYGLISVFFLLTLAVYPFLPDLIPMHTNASGVIDRMGNKLEIMIFPLLFCIFLLVHLIFIKREEKKYNNKEKNSYKVMLYTGIALEFFFLIIEVIFLVFAFQSTGKTMETATLNINFIYFFLGIVIIIIGNIMPKVRMNSTFGLRTTWSMANDRCWSLSQRYGGYSFCISGFLICIATVFAPQEILLLIILAIVLIDGIFSLTLSYLIYKKYA